MTVMTVCFPCGDSNQRWKIRLLMVVGVLNICATGVSLDEVREKVYAVAKKIDFEGKYYRSDIGLR